MAADPTPFAKLVPGFEFLQGMMGKAGAGMPDFGQWIAPTVDPVELDKRIEQLKTVQFWLEQNTRMISASIQALEVQRMTLSTLQSMNLPMADLASALMARAPAAAAAPAPTPTPSPAPASEPQAPPKAAAASAQAPAGAVDPMQWWNALTNQFGELASKAVRDMAAEDPVAKAAASTTASPSPNKPARKPAGKTAAAKSRPAKRTR